MRDLRASQQVSVPLARLEPTYEPLRDLLVLGHARLALLLRIHRGVVEVAETAVVALRAAPL
eukprot:CAMPEP_0179214576 /NCGR_PEP_ID=MMETSP0797-20121207/2392_1 /TAXON_ID=47934 /ORGANISM="Dinophysis acuminata, Strain DAEP01" /LENGTH=61 /DNA_ID=CAMNT_0020920623 /DNA_START=175 /DNA_END=357 /DNA_ORIENTATION=+